MAQSLKERHVQRRLQKLQEQVRDVDRQVLAEAKFTSLLVEAMNEDDLEKVSAIVDKLDTLKAPELPHLTAAIEQAQADLNKYTAGGPLTKAWGHIKQAFGAQNPVVKVMTLADALERGFSQIPTILKNNGVNLQKVDLNKSLAKTLISQPTQSSMVSNPTGKDVPGKDDSGYKKPQSGPENPTGAKSDQEMGKTSYSGKPVPDDDKIQVPEGHQMNEAPPKGPSGQQKLKNIVAQLQKALSPGGIFGVFKKVPYIDNAVLAKELISAPLRVFSNIAKKVQAGAQVADVANDMKGQITGQGDAQTKHTSPTGGTSGTQQTNNSQPTGTTTGTTGTTGNNQVPNNGPNAERGGGGEPDMGKKLINVLNKEFNLDAQTATKLLKRFEAMGVKFPSGPKTQKPAA